MLDYPVSLLGIVIITILCLTAFFGIYTLILIIKPLPTRLTLVELEMKSYWYTYREMISELENLGFKLGRHYGTKEYSFLLANLFKDDEAITAVVYFKMAGENAPDYFWMELILNYEDGTRVIASNILRFPEDENRKDPPWKIIRYEKDITAAEMLESLRQLAKNVSSRQVIPTNFKSQYEADVTREIAWLKETCGNSPVVRLKRQSHMERGGL
ncbi:MAG: hypothetical protein PHD40_03445 [Syntrophomonadaceae bacterium]|nr:hypothetical protein [Syntrophomonadaceae bacterium]